MDSVIISNMISVVLQSVSTGPKKFQLQYQLPVLMLSIQGMRDHLKEKCSDLLLFKVA